MPVDAGSGTIVRHMAACDPARRVCRRQQKWHCCKVSHRGKLCSSVKDTDRRSAGTCCGLDPMALARRLLVCAARCRWESCRRPSCRIVVFHLADSALYRSVKPRQRRALSRVQGLQLDLTGAPSDSRMGTRFDLAGKGV